MKIKICDLDIIFLSYDEPNAEENYIDLKSKIPWAKRVHGVKGSDAAHKACAELADTNRFVIIDADNKIDPQFLAQEVEMEDQYDYDNCVINWSSINIINNLQYGNGSIKCWTKQTIQNMRTHELADPSNIRAQVDFCWDIKYFLIDECFSTVCNNGSPFQAWRAGFREGVKMGLEQGVRPTPEEFLQKHWKNLHRLYVWCMVGSDIENGLWSIYGARAGIHKLMCTDWDFTQVRDFDYLKELWNDMPQHDVERDRDNQRVGKELLEKIQLPIARNPLDPEQSRFVKHIFPNPTRLEDE